MTTKLSSYSVLILIALALSACSHLTPIPAGDSGRQFLVTFADENGGARPSLGSSHVYGGNNWQASLHVRARIKALEQRFAVRELEGWPIKSLNLYCVLFEQTAEQPLTELMNTISAHEGIASVQPMNQFIALGATYDDPQFSLQYGDYAPLIELLHGYTRGEKVRIGIVDSPADGEHPDLRGQIKKQYDFVGRRETKDQQHGTAMAGIIAAAADNGLGVVGLAPGAEVFVYGACASSGQETLCNSFSLAKAIEHAIGDGIEVMNLSLAGPEDPLLAALIRQARKRGMTIVAAENGSSERGNFPASMPEVKAIDGYPESPGTGYWPIWFASGERLSTRAGGGYQFYYGNSVAAAGATGLAALLRHYWPATEAESILDKLLQAHCQTSTREGVQQAFLSALYHTMNCGTEQPVPSQLANQGP